MQSCNTPTFLNFAYLRVKKYLTIIFSLISSDPEKREATPSLSADPAQNMSTSPEQDQTITPGNNLPMAVEIVSPDSTSPGLDETITQRER